MTAPYRTQPKKPTPPVENEERARCWSQIIEDTHMLYTPYCECGHHHVEPDGKTWRRFPEMP